MKRRWLKRIMVSTGVLLLLAALSFLTFSFWYPYLLRSLASHFGVHYGKFEKSEGDFIQFHDIQGRFGQTDFSIAQLQTLSPKAWYYLWKGDQTNASLALQISGWKLTVHSKASASRQTNDPLSIYRKFEQTVNQLMRWVPRATFSNGKLLFQGKEYFSSTIQWNQGRLEGDVIWEGLPSPADFKGKFEAGGTNEFIVQVLSLDLSSRLRAHQSNNLVVTELRGRWKTNIFRAQAAFGSNSIWPAYASVSATDFALPPKWIAQTPYPELNVTLKATVTNQNWNMQITGGPPTPDEGASSDKITVAAHGNSEEATITQFSIGLPGVEARLENEVTIDLPSGEIAAPALLNAKIRLETIPKIKATGEVSASFLVKTNGGKFPMVEFQAESDTINSHWLKPVNELKLLGQLAWPNLQISNIVMRGGEKSFLVAQGSFDISRKMISGGSFKAVGNLKSSLIPLIVGYEEINTEATFSGSITNLGYNLTFAINNLELPGLNPLNLEGQTSGTNLNINTIGLRARSGVAELKAEGSAVIQNGEGAFRLNRLDLTQGDLPLLTNTYPAMVKVLRDPFLFSLGRLNLEGVDTKIELSGNFGKPDSFWVKGRVENFDLSIFQPFIKRPLRGLELTQLVASITNQNNQLIGSMELQVATDLQDWDQTSIDIHLKAEAEGLHVARGEIEIEGEPIFSAVGFLPVNVELNRKPIPLKFHNRATANFHLRTEPNPVFWSNVTKLTQVEFGFPHLLCVVTTRQDRIVGDIHFTASSLNWLGGTQAWPMISNVNAHFITAQDYFKAELLSLEVQSQPFTLTGHLGITPELWRTRIEHLPRYVFINSDCSVLLSNWNVAAFKPFLPAAVSPEGILSLAVQLTNQGEVNGTLSLTNLSTRPIKTFSPVHDIAGELQIRNSRLEFGELSAKIGGETLRINGHLDVRNYASGIIESSVRLQGTNIVLAREPDFVIRSDLDLLLTNEANGNFKIRGNTRLRDSFLLRDLSLLIPGKTTSQERRPPYFKIRNEPFANWNLDVQVKGQEFIRIRTPLFVGVASANLSLRGTMEEPLALGDVRINSGSIQFPFANLAVQQSLVTLTAENPYRPDVFMVAGSRVYGYDIKMEVRGPADDPVVEFSSVPSLTSEQIVLMLTAGELPRNELTFSNEQKLGKLALFLGKSFWAKINSGAADADRLIIRSGEEISEQGRQSYNVEYKLSENWSLIGEYDRFSALNAGFKWRLYSR
ncbi:MAG: translocation/assembly module TamB domain-containing protein [Verrucomicrobiota bacterium]|nr:translocation/assembly module TamB domain-containing protein [Verrucomicrobiota bacterium]